MKLTLDQRQMIDTFIKNKWTLHPKCPICHKNSWNVSPELFELRSFHGGSMVIGGKGGIVPLILVTCVNCGNTILINALIAGLDIKGDIKNE